jgi:hypothetical protein
MAEIALAIDDGGMPARERLRLRRERRARIAERLRRGAPVAAATLGWEALDAAPDWLGVSDEALLLWQRRVGAVFCAPALRRWIDARRVQALRGAVGDAFYRALLRAGDPLQAAALPAGLPDWPQGQAEGGSAGAVDPAAVAPLLRGCGAAVLVCTLPHGALRHAVSQALAPLAELMMPAPHALALAERALQLGTATPAAALSATGAAQPMPEGSAA